MAGEGRSDEDREHESGADDPEAIDVPPPPDLPDVPRLEPKLPVRRPAAQSGSAGPGSYGKMAIAATAATSFIMPIIVLSVVGVFLDRKLHSDPWGAFIGVLVGFVAGVGALINVVRRLGE